MQRFIGNRDFRITRVWARNFRSIADSVLELTPLTVLVGPNASGKSNVLDILHFLSDTLRTDLEAALSPRHGIGSIRRRQRGGRPRNIEIGVIAETRRYSFDYSFTIAADSDGDYRVGRERGEFSELSDEASTLTFSIRNGKLVTPKLLLADQPPLWEDEAEFDPANLALPSLRRSLRHRSIDGEGEADRRLYYAAFDFQRSIGNLRCYHMFPNTIREPQEVSNPYPLDEDGRNLTSVLREMYKRWPHVMDRLKGSLHDLIPSVTDLRIVSAGGYLVTQLRHDDLSGRSAWFNLAQESDGTVRLLGLLVALYQYPYVPFIGIEEPELTVHPGALMVLADLLQEASRRSQILVTTHSPDLIDRLPVQNIRVVISENGITWVGPVSETQAEAVRQNLFSPGELHRMEGLAPGGRS